jgi:DNA-binding NarL/FixJ family response regulator
MSGLDAAVALRRALPPCNSMIPTTFGRPGYLRRAMESGVAGFLLTIPFPVTRPVLERTERLSMCEATYKRTRIPRRQAMPGSPA